MTVVLLPKRRVSRVRSVFAPESTVTLLPHLHILRQLALDAEDEVYVDDQWGLADEIMEELAKLPRSQRKKVLDWLELEVPTIRRILRKPSYLV